MQIFSVSTDKLPVHCFAESDTKDLYGAGWLVEDIVAYIADNFFPVGNIRHEFILDKPFKAKIFLHLHPKV